MPQDFITVVSGLPRSGTSMMMKILEAGGMEILFDNLRQADEDNPKGYYEFEKVKQLKDDQSWLNQAKGKAVKIISELLKHLPGDYRYKIIFMQRKMEEILASQKQMLIRRGQPTDTISDERIAEVFAKHLKKIESYMSKQSNFEILHINYNDILKNPEERIKEINFFLGDSLDESKMLTVIDKQLHRQKR